MLGAKIGFDLGTTSILALVEGKGIKINEPSVIAYDTFTDKVRAIGNEAYNMIGRSPDSITVIRPMREGSVFNYEAVQQMLCYYIQKICGNQIFKPSVIVCVPSDVTELEKRTVLDLVTSSGAARACVIEEPLAAALGAGISINEHKGTLIIDIGGGTTDLAVITKGCVAVSASTDIAGKIFDEDICRFAKRERDTIIGEVTAESVKKLVGATKFLDAELAVRAVGKDYLSKLPKSVEITSTDVFLCIREHLEQLIESIRLLLERTPPELNADILTNGIIITGGGALLRGIDEYIQKRTGIRTRCAENPLLCVVNGIGTMFDDMSLLADNGYVFKSYMEIKDFEE
jgi:rod shape-determining protein MreB